MVAQADPVKIKKSGVLTKLIANLLIFSATLALLPGIANAFTCNLADGVRSLNSRISTAITFRNATTQKANILWIGFTGNRTLYRVLEPNENYTQRTFATHAWIVTDSDNNCLAFYIATSSPQVAVFTANRETPASPPRKGFLRAAAVSVFDGSPRMYAKLGSP
jgi:von Hippel-Lindau disease tumor supressor